MKKIIFVIWILLIMRYSLTGCSNPSDSNLTSVAEYEGGQLFTVGSLHVLCLRGSHYQMSRQYGMLRKDKLNPLYDLATIKYNSVGQLYQRLVSCSFAV